MKEEQIESIPTITLAKNGWILYFVGGLMLMIVLVVPASAIYDYFRALKRGELRPEGIDWKSVLQLTVPFLLCYVLIMFEVWTELKVKFTVQGITKLGYRGKTFIKWAEVKQVSRKGWFIEIKSTDRRIKINTNYYQNRSDLYRLLIKFVSESTS